MHSVIRFYALALIMEVVGSCETSVRFYQATQCHVSEDTTLHELHCGELLKTNGVCKGLISAISRNESLARLFCKYALFPEQRGSVADIAIRYGLDISGFEPRWGKGSLFSVPVQTASLLYSEFRRSLPRVKRQGRGVEVCLYSPFLPPVPC